MAPPLHFSTLLFLVHRFRLNIYHQTAEDVKRILTLAAEYGIFDVTLFRECGVLTSAGIQRQYLFSTKRRKSSAIDNRFNLITDEQEDDDAGKQGEAAGLFPETSGSETEVSAALPEVSTTLPESAMGTSQNVTLIPENVASGTLMGVAQQSIAQRRHRIPPSSIVPPRGDCRTRTGSVCGGWTERRRIFLLHLRLPLHLQPLLLLQRPSCFAKEPMRR